jgi:hypothetical protein
MLNDTHSLRRGAALMAFAAASLVLASIVHFATSSPEGADGAGVAEATIAVVLLAGIVALLRDPVRGRLAALGATAFAVVGFLVGLTFTLRGGEAGDVVYHLTMLPVLILTLVLLGRTGSARAH